MRKNLFLATILLCVTFFCVSCDKDDTKKDNPELPAEEPEPELGEPLMTADFDNNSFIYVTSDGEERKLMVWATDCNPADGSYGAAPAFRIENLGGDIVGKKLDDGNIVFTFVKYGTSLNSLTWLKNERGDGNFSTNQGIDTWYKVPAAYVQGKYEDLKGKVGYIAVKFVIQAASGTSYDSMQQVPGWMRVEVAGNGRFMDIYDYGYGEDLKVGEGGKAILP